MIDITSVSRRDFLKWTALSTSGLILGSVGCTSKNSNITEFSPNLFITIPSSGKIKLVNHRSEMGNGVRTSIIMLLCEELNVSPNDIEIVQATGNSKYGDQNTDGSKSIRLNYERLRVMAAAAREMIETAAATQWGTKRSQLKSENGFVIYNGKKAPYGEFSLEASKLEVPKAPTLKNRSEFKLLEKKIPLIDGHDLAAGKAVFGMDVEVENMVYACLVRCPSVGGKVISHDDTQTLKVAGVIKTIQLSQIPNPVGVQNAIAVIANNTWAAFDGAEKLKVEWDLGDNSKNFKGPYEDYLKDKLKEADKKVHSVGDVDKNRTKKSVKQIYHSPFLVHAPMEPLVATAHVEKKRVKLWTPSQDPQRVRKSVASFLKLPLNKIEVNVTFLGGGFGRKSQADFSLEAVALSQLLEGPVKVVWRREDEIQHGFYHAQAFQEIEATLDSKGVPVTWEHKTVYPTIMSLFIPSSQTPAKWETGMGATSLPYNIPNISVKTAKVKSPVRIGWLRAVCNIQHSFAINCFVDKLARSQGIDPVDYRKLILGRPVKRKTERGPQDTARLISVINQCKNMSGWKDKVIHKKKMGFSAHNSFRSYIAMAVEIEGSSAEDVTVKQVDVVIDCGKFVNKDTIIAQMEGSVVFGIGALFYGKIDVVDGVIQQSNFHDYPVLRHEEMPIVNVQVVISDEEPGGVGEPGVPVIMPALANAITSAFGNEISSFPVKA
ncbi:MAG: xanthine dehydrogenase family protein molybdopterin-binding subunit [Bacteriovoracaceae bacterium]|jgi:isoquinoline 1-oxidoreductase subunit beta|nr:xanthine dehydrogenase family protein molybdopterin-binding subunit [Bacteriovoracaceae bacterium]